MIDISLTEQTVDVSSYEAFNNKLPCLFLGFAIKNEYDNQRLEICDKFKPEKQLFVFEKTNLTGQKTSNKDCEYGILPLYGLFLDLNEKGIKLSDTLLNEDLSDNLNINNYEKILFEYKLTCNESYSYLNKRIYPVDINHLKELTYNSVRDDGKILQHLLNIDETKFNFQKFGSLKLLILI